MNKLTYEVISLSPAKNPNLPLVFHTDKVEQKKSTALLSNWHEEIEILTVLSGFGILHCDNEELAMNEGDVMVINSGSMHSITSEGRVLYHCMIIDADFCREMGADTSTLRFKTLIKDELLHSTLCALADNVKAFNEGGEKHLALLAKAKTLEALAILTKDYITEPSKSRQTNDENASRIKKAIVYICDHIAEQITLDEIASAVGISKFHLSREFKKMTDMTIFNFIILTRLKLARRLIRQGHSVSESALSSGFENLSYFSKKFKQNQGMSPSEYSAKYKAQKSAK